MYDVRVLVRLEHVVELVGKGVLGDLSLLPHGCGKRRVERDE